MPVDTGFISCPAGSYTAIATDKANCSFRLKTIGSGRMVISTSAPAPGATNYVRVGSGKWVELGSMSGTEDVYFMPDSAAAIEVEFIRG